MYCFILYISFIISFVVGVRRGQWGCVVQIMTHFTSLFSSNKCANYPKHVYASAKYMSSLEVSKLSFVKAQLYVLGFANATFYLSSWNLLVIFTFTWLLFTSSTFYSTSSRLVSAISNNTFISLDFWTTFYTTTCECIRAVNSSKILARVRTQNFAIFRTLKRRFCQNYE